MQALVFAALLAFARATEGSRVFFGAVAGALLGLMLFLRYDVVLAMAAFAAAAAVLPVGQHVGLAFPVSLAATSLAGLWYLVNPMVAYSAYPLGFTRDAGGWALIAAGARGSRRVPLAHPKGASRTASCRRALPIGLAVAVTALGHLRVLLSRRGLSARRARRDGLQDIRVVPVTRGVWSAAVAGMAGSRRHCDSGATRHFLDHADHLRRVLLLQDAHRAGPLLGEPPISGRHPAGRAHRHCRTRACHRPIDCSAPASGTPRCRGALVASAPRPARAGVLDGVGASARTRRIRRADSAARAPCWNDRSDAISCSSSRVNAGSDLHVLALPLAYIYGKHVLVLRFGGPAEALARELRQLGIHDVRPRALPGRRRHRPAVPAPGRRAARERPVFTSRNMRRD